MAVAFGLNRWDWRTPSSFAAGVADAEAAGLGAAFLPVNPLSVPDPYVLLAAAAPVTRAMRLGPLLETPVLRPPAVAAGSIATLHAASDGRAMLVYGVGDTAVRWLGKRPATVDELEAATTAARGLLAGDKLEVGAARPAWLRHSRPAERPAPVWVAAGGPRTLRMAGRAADGVFLRVGTHPANLRAAIANVRAGAAEAGRDPAAIELGIVVHTCWPADGRLDATAAGEIGRAMAAGFYEYSPALFSQAGLGWPGPDMAALRTQIWPDFHHAADLRAAGRLVPFLDEETAHSFSFAGSGAEVAAQIRAVLAEVPEISLLVAHPVPNPTGEDCGRYVRWLGDDVLPSL